MCLCGIYRCTIILLYVSVQYVQVHYKTAVCVCGMYR